MQHRKWTRAALTVALLVASAAVQASAASFTAVNTNPGEPSLFAVLDSVYGAGNYERISDDLDAVWASGDIIGITAIGKMAQAKQRLGLCELCDGTDNFQFGPTVSQGGILSITLFDGTFTFKAPSFRWYDAAFGNAGVGTVYSDTSLNVKGFDQMVTFAAVDRPGVFVLGFEDWPSNIRYNGSDRDFNDFIVEVRFAVPVVEPPLDPLPPANGVIPSVPEPAGIALLGGALLILGLAGARRKLY